MKPYSQNDPLDDAFGKIRELPPSVSYNRVEDYVMRLAATGLPMAAAAKPAFIKFPFKSIYLNTALTLGIIGSVTVAVVTAFGSAGTASQKTAQLNFIPQVISSPTDTNKVKKAKLSHYVPLDRLDSLGPLAPLHRMPAAPNAPAAPCQGQPPVAPEPPAAPNPNNTIAIQIMNGNNTAHIQINDSDDSYAYAMRNSEDDREDGMLATVDGDVVLAVGNDLEIPDPPCVCNSELDMAFEEELIKDGLIQENRSYSFLITEKYLKVNGKKQSDAVYQKYRQLYEKVSGDKIKGEFSWVRNVNIDD
jgi:hypothetical protein